MKTMAILNVVVGLLDKVGFFKSEKVDYRKLLVVVMLTLSISLAVNFGFNPESIDTALDYVVKIFEVSEVKE